MRPRSAKDGPFCWQSKAVRRQIRDAFDASNNVATALGVYDALTEIASDAQAETFTTAHAWIASKCGVSQRTVQRLLKEFAAIGIVAVETPALRAPSRFTLLPFGNRGVTQCNPGVALRHSSKQPPCPTSEESDEESQKKDLNNLPPAKASDVDGSNGHESEPSGSISQPRSLLFDALAADCGSNLAEMTDPAKKACGVALAAILKAMPDVTTDEIQRRATKYHKLYRDAAITPSALCKHWAECGDGPTPTAPAADVYAEPKWAWQTKATVKWPGSDFTGKPWSEISTSIRADILKLKFRSPDIGGAIFGDFQRAEPI